MISWVYYLNKNELRNKRLSPQTINREVKLGWFECVCNYDLIIKGRDFRQMHA